MTTEHDSTTPVYDLLVKGGTLIDPAAGRHGLLDVALCGGNVAHVAANLPPGSARQVLDARGCYVTPGLIDMHTHIYWGVSALGVDVAALWPGSGVTTWVDAGTAGAITFPGFRRYVMEALPVRVLAFLNISSQGLLDIGVAGEYDDIRWCDCERAVAAIEAHRDCIVGVKVRPSRNGVREAGIEPLMIGREAADAAGVPLMVHIGRPPATLREIMPLLGPGDILTHVYRGPSASILTRQGEVRPDVLAARGRGIWTDVGHGSGSLDFAVARRALALGFLPDSLGTDLHTLNLRGPVFDMATTLSKFLALGLSLEQVIAAATAGPARLLGRAGELGTLAQGAAGDVTLLGLEDGRFSFRDSQGNLLEAEQRLVVRGMVVAGRPVTPQG
ncbi:MAG: amidohydrolase/deacetylase family metallohydrolase, partial [Chloroflexi bacterium]|nr:amidohydrolase/deacetylase family metallohydrolase [Chloroflexota bacterium]